MQDEPQAERELKKYLVSEGEEGAVVRIAARNPAEAATELMRRDDYEGGTVFVVTARHPLPFNPTTYASKAG